MSRQLTENANFADVNADEMRQVFGGMDEIVQLNSSLTSRYAEWVYKLLIKKEKVF